MNAMASDKKRMIIGLGMSGISCARYCQRQGWSFDLCDSRENPANIEAVQQEFPASLIVTGALNADVLCQYHQLIVSPGVALAEPAIQQAIAEGVEIIGD
ncbi:MAG: UDP-N-acetylmuramoyl-L-alanine--D-glutamate ligase, partial [Pseudomonadota bacterium]